MKVIVIGSGSMARMVIECLESDRNFKIAGLIDDEKTKFSIKQYEVIGRKEDLPAIKKEGDVDHAVIAIGDCDLREKISYKMDEYGFKLISCIHPSAIISSDVNLGTGTIIGPGVVIGTGVRLGNNVIVETGCIIGINTILNDNVSIQSGVTVGGGGVIGRNVTVMTGATIAGLLTIGKHNTVGVGEIIKKDIPDKPIS